jgi:hypothetical protein
MLTDRDTGYRGNPQIRRYARYRAVETIDRSRTKQKPANRRHPTRPSRPGSILWRCDKSSAAPLVNDRQALMRGYMTQSGRIMHPGASAGRRC